jgi:hypothetical protein
MVGAYQALVLVARRQACVRDYHSSSPSMNPNGILYWTCPMHADVKEAKPGKHDAAHCENLVPPVYAKDR